MLQKEESIEKERKKALKTLDKVLTSNGNNLDFSDSDEQQPIPFHVSTNSVDPSAPEVLFEHDNEAAITEDERRRATTILLGMTPALGSANILPVVSKLNPFCLDS